MSKRVKRATLVMVCALCFAPAAQAQLAAIGSLVNRFLSTLNDAGDAAAAQAELRNQALTLAEKRRGIPPAAIRATMSPPYGRLVTINGVTARLAPGAHIKDTKNRIILPARIQRDVAVRFLIDKRGEIRMVWLLSDQYYTRVVQNSVPAVEDTANLDAGTGERDNASR